LDAVSVVSVMVCSTTWSGVYTKGFVDKGMARDVVRFGPVLGGTTCSSLRPDGTRYGLRVDYSLSENVLAGLTI
jgi:hypothetical protein